MVGAFIQHVFGRQRGRLQAEAYQRARHDALRTRARLFVAGRGARQLAREGARQGNHLLGLRRQRGKVAQRQGHAGALRGGARGQTGHDAV